MVEEQGEQAKRRMKTQAQLDLAISQPLNPSARLLTSHRSTKASSSAPDPTVLGGSLGVKVTTLCVHIPPDQPRHNRGIKTPSAVLEPCLATDRLDDGGPV